MAEYNLIQRPDLILRLQQMLGIRQAHITPSLSETVQAVVIMGDARETGSEREIVRPAWGSISEGPFVGNFPRVSIHCPPTSGSIVTVRKIRVGNPLASVPDERTFNMRVFGPAFGGFASLGVAAQFRNSRVIFPGSGQIALPVAVLSSDLNPAGIAATYSAVSPSTEQIEIDVVVILTPGSGLAISTNVGGAAASIEASFIWEEQAFEFRA